MPVARALACDGADFAVLQQNMTSIDSCFKRAVYLTAGDYQECYEVNGVSVSCRACAATAYQDVSDCIYTCRAESPGRLCSRCLNQIRDDYDISGDPLVCGITKEYMSDFILALFKNDKINQLYVMNNVSNQLATPSPLPVKRDFNPASKSTNSGTSLPVDADASSPSSKSSFLPRKWTAILVLSVVLLSNL